MKERYMMAKFASTGGCSIYCNNKYVKNYRKIRNGLKYVIKYETDPYKYMEFLCELIGLETGLDCKLLESKYMQFALTYEVKVSYEIFNNYIKNLYKKENYNDKNKII